MSRRVDPQTLSLARTVLAAVHARLIEIGLPGDEADISCISVQDIPPAIFRPDNQFLLNSTFTLPEPGSQSIGLLLDTCASWAVHRHFRLQQLRAKQAVIPNTYDKPMLDGYKSARWYYFRRKVNAVSSD